jgi:Domain of unknown function (DUF4386)
MASRVTGSINSTARLAGGLYLILMPLGIFSFVYVPSVIFASNDSAATARNIIESGWLFRSATVSHLLSQIVVVFLVLALYRLLKLVNSSQAVLMVILALLGLPSVAQRSPQPRCPEVAQQPGKWCIQSGSAPRRGDVISGCEPTGNLRISDLLGTLAATVGFSDLQVAILTQIVGCSGDDRGCCVSVRFIRATALSGFLNGQSVHCCSGIAVPLVAVGQGSERRAVATRGRQT